MQIGVIASANIGVRVGKVANHVSHDVGKRVAVSNVGQELRVLVVLLLPIHAVHGSFIEVIAFLPPYFSVFLTMKIWKT